MRKIGLLSDTHSFLEPSVFDYFSNCDEVWHAGDIGNSAVAESLSAWKKLTGVYGNIDGHELRKIYPQHQRFFCEETDVWITHIGGYPGKYPPHIRNILKQNPPDIFICGHSHILKVIRDKEFNLLHINPGAAGKEGFHRVCTVVRFEIDGKNIRNLEVIEFGNR